MSIQLYMPAQAFAPTSFMPEFTSQNGTNLPALELNGPASWLVHGPDASKNRLPAFVTSTAAVKLAAPAACLREMSDAGTWDVFGIKAASDIAKQPVGAETWQGALNRLNNAKVKLDLTTTHHPVLGFSFENGIFPVTGADGTTQWVDAACVVVEHMSTGIRSFAVSPGIMFPSDDVDATRNQMGEFKDNTVGANISRRTGCDKQDPHAFLTDGLFPRASLLEHGAKLALLGLREDLIAEAQYPWRQVTLEEIKDVFQQYHNHEGPFNPQATDLEVFLKARRLLFMACILDSNNAQFDEVQKLLPAEKIDRSVIDSYINDFLPAHRTSFDDDDYRYSAEKCYIKPCTDQINLMFSALNSPSTMSDLSDDEYYQLTAQGIYGELSSALLLTAKRLIRERLVKASNTLAEQCGRFATILDLPFADRENTKICGLGEFSTLLYTIWGSNYLQTEDALSRGEKKQPNQSLFIGLPDTTLLTPPHEMMAVINKLQPASGSTFVDIGCGYATNAMVLAGIRPDMKYHGYEILAGRAAAGQSAAKNWQIDSKVKIEQANVADPSTQIIDGDIFYFYDPLDENDLKTVLEKLKVIAQNKKIRIVARDARGHLQALLQSRTWLTKIDELETDRKPYIIYESTL